MRFSVCLLAVGVLSLSLAHADQIDLQKASKVYQLYDVAYNKADEAFVAAQKSVVMAQASTRTAETAYNKILGEFETTYGKRAWYAIGAGKGTPEDNAKLEKAKADLDAAKKAQEKAESAVRGANKALLDMGGKRNDAKEQVADARESIDALFKQQNLMMKMSDLQKETGSLDAALFSLNQKLDKAIIGVYVKEKMQNMLNDKDLFCAAKNQCDGKGGPVTDKAMDRLFNGAAYVPAAAPAASAPAAQPAAKKSAK